MRRHPLLWKLALLQISFCLLLTWIIWTWGLSAERSTYFLDQADQLYLARYAQQAEDVWHNEGSVGVERFRQQLSRDENTWVAVIGAASRKSGHHATDRAGSQSSDLHAHAALADESASAG
jgi:two-component system sensor histidine kinase PfeS